LYKYIHGNIEIKAFYVKLLQNLYKPTHINLCGCDIRMLYKITHFYINHLPRGIPFDPIKVL
jgi:hypothetical protein